MNDLRERLKGVVYLGCMHSAWRADKLVEMGINCAKCDATVDALMPIVREAVRDGCGASYVCCGQKPHAEWLDAHVRRVCGE